MAMEGCSEVFWKIPDFLNREKEENIFIASPEFTIIDDNGKLAKFDINLYPKVDTKSGYVSVYLRCLVESSTATFKINILGTQKKYEYTDSDTFKKDEGSGWTKFIAIDDLEKNHNNILPDGTLTLELKIKQGRLLMSVYKLSTKANT